VFKNDAALCVEVLARVNPKCLCIASEISAKLFFGVNEREFSVASEFFRYALAALIGR